MYETYEQLKRAVLACEEDVKKASGGTKAAGTRVRKSMQEVKALAQELRKQLLGGREEETDAEAK